MCGRYSFDSYRYSVLEFDKFGFVFYVVVVVFFDSGFRPVRKDFQGCIAVCFSRFVCCSVFVATN